MIEDERVASRASDWISQIHCRHILPAISVNKLRSDAGKMPAIRMHGCVRANAMRVLLRKKINVKRVNC
jgi:hypothetical protein